MRRKAKKNAKDGARRLDPTIIVALIGLVGTVIAALLASPLLERWLSPQPSAVHTPQSANDGNAGTQTPGTHVGLNQTVSGTLYYNEPGTWIFSEGPARVTIVVDMSPYGDALLILFDPSGVQREYVEQQSPGIARLVNYNIPDDGDYTLLVRNAKNEQVNYTLIVQDALTPPPP
jgi:hypothetical protein